MRHADDGVMLTEREREVLAELAGSIGDPWLARQLTGGEATGNKPARQPRRRPSWLRRPTLAVLSGWAGVALGVAGAGLALATFVVSTALAAIGLAMMGIGLWRVVIDRRGLVARWIARRRAASPPPETATPPRPPRTPPAAG